MYSETDRSCSAATRTVSSNSRSVRLNLTASVRLVSLVNSDSNWIQCFDALPLHLRGLEHRAVADSLSASAIHRGVPACAVQFDEAGASGTDGAAVAPAAGLIRQHLESLFFNGVSPRLALPEPMRPEFFKLIDSKFRNIFPPLRHRARRDLKQVSQRSSVPGQFDDLVCFHGSKFTTLNKMSASPLNDLTGLIPVMSLKDRIQELIDAGFKQTELAKASGKSRAAVSHWLSGETLKIKSDSAAGLQALTGYSSIWISTGRGVKKGGNTAPGPTMRGVVPLLTNTQAGMCKELVNNLLPSDGKYEPIPTTVPVNRYTFALRVIGDSMEPKFKEGMVLVVEPELDPQPGDFVIAKNGGEETTFKQLVKDGADWYLKPLNERYPIKPLGANTIIGVVRAVEDRFR